MTTIRVAKRRRYTAIEREAINDDRLSFRARGVLFWLLDKPDDWIVDSERIAAKGKEGRDAIRTALNELAKLGYIKRTKRQAEHGHWVTETVVFESPDDVPPATDFQAPDGRLANRPSEDRASESQSLKTEDGEQKTDTPCGPPTGDVGEVFDAWREATGHPGAKLDRSRRRVIESRLKDYSVADLVAAVRGWRHSPHHRGENERRIVYNDLKLLLRDAAHVEQFRDLERNGQVTTRTAGPVGSQPPPRECPGGICGGNTWAEDPNDPASVVPCPACRPTEQPPAPPHRHLSSV